MMRCAFDSRITFSGAEEFPIAVRSHIQSPMSTSSSLFGEQRNTFIATIRSTASDTRKLMIALYLRPDTLFSLCLSLSSYFSLSIVPTSHPTSLNLNSSSLPVSFILQLQKNSLSSVQTLAAH